MDGETLSSIGFSHFFGIGPLHFKSLLTVFHTASTAYQAAPDKLEQVIGISLTRRFIEYRDRTDLARLHKEITKKNISVLCQKSALYPEALRTLEDPPICLYVKGDRSLLYNTRENAFAIVGTRNPTSYGAQLARHFASSLAEHGFTIISGMALGIDALAHWGTLEARGKTIAVLGCGVDIIYPPSHTALYKRILTGGGAVISEFPPGHTVRRGLFVVRNRLISGLSRGLLVVEGTDRSGTLTTARYAADQGKPVFAPPAPINSSVSQAPNMLLKQGAVLVTGIEDILNEFGMRRQKKPAINPDILSADEKQIVGLLQKEDSSIDELVYRLHLPSAAVSVSISHLELMSVIEKDCGGKYRLRLA